MKKWLKKMAFFYETQRDAIMSVDIKKQRMFLEHLTEPQDDVERSFNQYKCQMYLYNSAFVIIINVAAFFLTNIYLFKYMVEREKKIEKISVNAVFFRDGKPENILPDSLKAEFENIEYNPAEGTLLVKEDFKFILTIIKKHPFSWFFILKIVLKLARYRFVIEKYSPRAIIVCAEYSYTSSVLTRFCEKNEIYHINVMHGEKFFYIRDSFFRYQRCYIWDEFYKQLFVQLHAEKQQFVIEIPNSLKFEDSVPIEKRVDYTYYIAAENKEQLMCIESNLRKLKHEKKIAIRPHPRYSDMNIVKQIFDDYCIENVEEVSIEESILQTRYAISLFSTVLNQAYQNGVPIIIDDLSNKEKYRKLKEIQYIMLKKEHLLLSEVVKNV